MKTCTNCRREIPGSSKFCKFCGASQLDQTSNNCQFCGSSLPDRDLNFCPVCGKRISKNKQSRQKQIIAPEGEKHNCSICRQEIQYDLIFCPSCVSAFHFNHLSSWVLERNECPVCKTRLEFAE